MVSSRKHSVTKWVMVFCRSFRASVLEAALADRSVLVWEELLKRELGAQKRNLAGAVGYQKDLAGSVTQRKECQEQPLAKSVMSWYIRSAWPYSGQEGTPHVKGMC